MFLRLFPTKRSATLLLSGLTISFCSLYGYADESIEPFLDSEKNAEVTASAEYWLLAKYDTNGDTIISTNEVSEKRQKVFNYMDKDQTGDVSFSEYSELDAKKRELLLKARFAKLDADKNGRLSESEYSEYKGNFSQFDANGDGKVSLAEINRDGKKDAKQQKASLKKKSGINARCFMWVCVRKW